MTHQSADSVVTSPDRANKASRDWKLLMGIVLLAAGAVIALVGVVQLMITVKSFVVYPF